MIYTGAVIVLVIAFIATSIALSVAKETVEDLREQLNGAQAALKMEVSASTFIRAQRDKLAHELEQNKNSLADAYRRIAELDNGGGLG